MRRKYSPPLRDIPEYLKSCPIHSWRAEKGIELIHEEPSREELERIYKNYKSMPQGMKRLSDTKSKELFGMNNREHYRRLSVPVVGVEKVAISEQRVINAIGKRMDSIVAAPKEQQAEKALNTYWQMKRMGGRSLDRNRKPKGLPRVLGTEKANIVRGEDPLGMLAVTEDARRRLEIAQHVVDGNYGKAGDLQGKYEHASLRRKLPGWEEYYQKTYPVGSSEAINTRDTLQSIYNNNMKFNSSIDPAKVDEYKKLIGVRYAENKRVPKILQYAKSHPYRSAAIGIGTLGLAGAGALGLREIMKNRNRDADSAIGKKAGIGSVGKFMFTNPYAKRIALGTLGGAAIGGTAKMMAGTVEDQGKNFLKGSLIGAGVGAAAGTALAGKKAWNVRKLKINMPKPPPAPTLP